MNRSLIVGITGQSGSGKTMVANLLNHRLGFSSIDADIVAKKVVEAGKPAIIQLTNYFGKRIVTQSGELDRAALGEIVFNNKSEKAKMEQIIFPHILKEIQQQIEMLKSFNNTAIFLDAPTLFESGADSMCDRVLAVVAPRSVRMERILARDTITLEQARARLDSQREDSFYTSRADFTINNEGEPHEVENQIEEMLRKFGINNH